jgi:hypothetical protein
VSTARVELALPSSSGWCLLPLGYVDWSRCRGSHPGGWPCRYLHRCLLTHRPGAAPRTRTGPPALRGQGHGRRAAACIPIQLPGLDSNQRGQGPEPCWAADSPPGIAEDRAESRTSWRLARWLPLPRLPKHVGMGRGPERAAVHGGAARLHKVRERQSIVVSRQDRGRRLRHADPPRCRLGPAGQGAERLRTAAGRRRRGPVPHRGVQWLRSRRRTGLRSSAVARRVGVPRGRRVLPGLCAVSNLWRGRLPGPHRSVRLPFARFEPSRRSAVIA